MFEIFKRPYFYILLFFIFFFYFFSFSHAQSIITSEEKDVLESQLKELENQIKDTEKELQVINQKGKTLKNEIDKYDKDIKKNTIQIKAIDLTIKKLDSEIVDNTKKVETTEAKINDHKVLISEIINLLHEKEGFTIIEILLQNSSISNFFNSIKDLESTQDKLRSSMHDVKIFKEDLLNQREVLALKKSDQTELKSEKDNAQKALEKEKKDRDELLKVTKGKESKYKEILAVSKKTAAQIRSRLFEFLGGGEMSFGDAYAIAKQVSNLTGTSPAFILAVLDKESALGKNVGRCDYKSSMHPTRDIPTFLEITSALKLDPDKTLVSCAISQDGAYGGAMGPAQFIPSTWKIYSSRIESLTGVSPSNPWRNLDAFTATALYIKDARESTACINYGEEIPSQRELLKDRCAAAKYYAGNRWRTYRFTYGERVVQRIAKFEEDIKSISEQ